MYVGAVQTLQVKYCCKCTYTHIIPSQLKHINILLTTYTIQTQRFYVYKKILAQNSHRCFIYI